MTTETLAPIGHNKPPIVPPADTDFLEDLKRRYPEIPKKLAEFEDALKGYPDKLTLADKETAAALQDLLGQIKKEKTVWGAHKKSEKKPWDGLVKIVQNFFTTAEAKADEWIEKWKPVHQQYLDLESAENERKAREAAEAQRAEAERLRLEAEAAEARRLKAIEDEAAARRREAEAIERAAEQERIRKAAEEAAEAARIEEKRIAEERKVAERAEKEGNVTAIRQIKGWMKDAERLHTLCEADEATPEETAELDRLVRTGGIIGNCASPVANSFLLDDDQKAYIEGVRARLGELRVAFNARFDAKERKRREKERRAAEAAELEAAQARALARMKQEALDEAARQERLKREAEADAARAAEKAAKGEAREARADQREAVADQRTAGREARAHEEDADRTLNRADRLDRRIAQGTDTPLRGELGTTGSLSGSWKHVIVDEAALRAVSGPLGEHFTEDALSGAAYRFMQARREGFEGERVEGLLPGVLFFWERNTMIRT